MKSPVAGSPVRLIATANVTHFARQRFRTHHDRNGIEAFSWLTSRNAIISGGEWQRNIIRGLCHGTHPVAVMF
jgi:hypothetical protein